LLAAGFGIVATSAMGELALGQRTSALSSNEDETAAHRYDKERRFVETSFGRAAYIERGTGPAALFLHGFPLSSFQWRGAIDRLSGKRRCLAPDFMGLGHTEVASGQSITPAAQVEMIAAFLDRLGVEQVDLIANDSGGAVAQLFVTRHRERVRTLLLTNCDVENDSPPAAVQPIIDLAYDGLYPDLWLEPWLRHKDVARSPTGLGGLCYSDPRHPTDAAIDQYLGPLVASAARKALVNQYAMGLTPNPLQGIEPLLRKCSVPTRIVWGMSDTIFSRTSPDYLAGILPQVTGIRRIRQAKLFFPEEYPDIIAQEADRLWAGRASG
jgi:pimeloyl-ACP methyl ester carboxylesterase